MMKKVKIICCLLLYSLLGIAQTFNTGTLVISPQTKVSSIGVFTNASNGNVLNDGELYVYSDLVNQGLVSFTPGVSTGLTVLKGFSGSQTIAGTSPIDLNNVRFENSTVQPAFYLENEVTVFGQSNFLKGILKTDAVNSQLIFENDATTSNANDDSYVDGTVIKKGNHSFQFPVGNSGYYRYVSQSAPNGAKAAFASRYFFENANAQHPLENKESNIELIDDAEYWKIERTSGDSVILVTLSWNEATTPQAIVTGPYEEIHVVRWDDAVRKWVDEGGVVDHLAKEVTTISSVLADDGVFTLARVKMLPNNVVFNCAGEAITVMNAISPNGDGLNDFLKITGISKCPNRVIIYNRSGVKVFETNNYDTNGNVFKGFSEGDLTINRGKGLPDGTYFYILTLTEEKGTLKSKEKAGYLYLSN